jgi:DNA-binding CsgD family transcriptional regulator
MARYSYTLEVDLDDWDKALAFMRELERMDTAVHLIGRLPPAPLAAAISPRIGSLLGYNGEELLAMGGALFDRICLPEHLDALRAWHRGLPLGRFAPELRNLRFVMSFTAVRGDRTHHRVHYESKYVFAHGANKPWAKWVALRPDPMPPSDPFAGFVFRDSDGLVLPEYGPEPGAGRRCSLTAREREVLEYCALGYASAETARVLGLSLHTVHNHRRAILAKLDAANIADAIRLGLRDGLFRA